MVTCTFTRSYPFPPAALTAAVADPTVFPVWRDHLRDVVRVDGPPAAPGGRYRAQLDERGTTRDAEIEMLPAADATARYRIAGGSVPLTETWTVTGDDAPDTATVTFQLEVDVPAALTRVVTREAAGDIDGQWAALDRALQQGRIRVSA